MTGEPRRIGRAKRTRSWFPAPEQIPFLVVLGGVLLGLVVVAMHHFKRGSVLIAAALLLGAVLRLVLSDRRVGTLAVRTRAIDALSLGGLGVLLAIAALVIPPP